MLTNTGNRSQKWEPATTVTLEEDGGRTNMKVATIFDSEEQMEQMVQMGMEEGMREAVGQIDAILAEHANA